MKLPRFYFTEALIVLPFLAVLALTVFFAVRELPRFDKRENDRIASFYHDLALEVRDGELPDIREIPLEGSRTRGRLGKKGTWGFEPLESGRVRVWYRAPHAETRRAVEIEALASENNRAVYRNSAFALLIIVLLLTNFGLRRFRRFLSERDDFIAATAHDLVTPVSQLPRLIRTQDPEALVVAEHMKRLVANLTDFLNLDGAQAAPKVTRFDLCAAFKVAYALFKEDIGDKLIVEGEKELFVRADETLVVQILWNLLANEVKYALKSGPIRVVFASEGARALVRFIDVGEGLSAKERARVFDRYYRSRGARRSGKGGFGIGLATAREAARRMDGDLTVAANSPKGCVFTLTLQI